MKNLKKLIKAIIIVLLLEITVFNFRYYTTKLSGLEKETIEISQENVTSNDYKENEFVKEYTILLNKEVQGIKLNIQQEENENIVIEPTFTDGSAKYEKKSLNSIVYNQKYRNSNYIVLNSQEECIELKLRVISLDVCRIKSIEINTWYFEFNIYRVIVLISIVSIIIYRKEINSFFEKHKKAKKYFYTWFILIGVIIYQFYANGFGQIHENKKSYDQKIFVDPYKMLTQSIVNGKVSLEFPTEFKEQLQTLEDYKDYSERGESDIPYFFDVAFYNGNYYCYYGIVPVLTVLLPIALITGIYCYSNVICVVYATLISILLLKIYFKLLEKFKINMGFLLEFFGYIALFLSTGIYRCIISPNFYEAADMSGITWGLIAMLLVLNMDNNKRVKLKMFFAGLSYGLMVCSRPIYVFYIIPLIIGLFKYIFENRKINIKRGVVFTIPIIIIALLQMWYNYVRFNNPLEFGQFYQLTINDPSEQKIDLGMAIDGLDAYLFNPPIFDRDYPFVELKTPNVKNGNIIYKENVVGIFWHPFLLILVTLVTRIKNNKNIKIFKILSISIIIIGIIIMALNTCLAGMNQRYLTDIMPALSILAFISWLMYIKESENEQVKIERMKVYKLFCYISVVLIFMYAITNIDVWSINKDTFEKKDIIEYEIKHMIEFYK